MAVTRLRVPLRWADLDAYGHVNNTDLLRVLEQARLGALVFEHIPGQTGVLIVRHEIEYLVPVPYLPEGVDVDLWTTRVGAADFDLGYEVRSPGSGSGSGSGAGSVSVSRVEPGPGSGVEGPSPAARTESGPTVFARAASRLVAYDFRRSAPRRLTADERRSLAALSGPPVGFRHRR